jgi:hypothetical protein
LTVIIPENTLFAVVVLRALLFSLRFVAAGLAARHRRFRRSVQLRNV